MTFGARMWKCRSNDTYLPFIPGHFPCTHENLETDPPKSYRVTTLPCGWLYFGRLQNHCRWWLQPWNHKRHLLLGRKVMTNLDSILESRDITLSTKVCLVKAMVFHVWMWELDYKESGAPKNWSFWTVGVGEDSWESLGLQGDPPSPS